MFLVEAARWGVWCAWGGALALFGIKLLWRWLDSLTSFGKAASSSPLPSRRWHLLGVSSRLLFTFAYAEGFALNALLLLVLPLLLLPSHLQFFHHPYPLLGLLLQLHLLRRLLECLFVHRFSPRLMSDANALLAASYYFFLCIGPWVEFIASRNGQQKEATRGTHGLGLDALTTLAGVCLFFYASWHQHVCHRILARLRSPGHRREDLHSSPSPSPSAPMRQRRPSPETAEQQQQQHLMSTPGQEGRYGLPTGDWFEYVSSPHYLAEILIYVSFVLVAGRQIVCLWLVLAFVLANLTRSALQTHRWYTGLFPKSLPKRRRALFPMLL